jgi:hypothetical protein
MEGVTLREEEKFLLAATGEIDLRSEQPRASLWRAAKYLLGKCWSGAHLGINWEFSK